MNKIDSIKLQMLIDQGLNGINIAKELQIPVKNLYYYVKKNKIKIQASRYLKKINHNFFEKIDTEHKAYFLGFILADGCIQIEPKKKNNVVYSYSKRLCFCNSIDDFEILNRFRKEVCPEAILKRTSNIKGAINRKDQIILRINSQKLVDDLAVLGIKPRKTYDTNFIFDFNLIPKDLHRHFIRGFFDGDGWFTYRGKSFGLIFTSLSFLKQIEKIFNSHLFKINTKVYSTQNKNMISYQLILNCGYGKYKDLFEFLYKDATIFLHRKYNKFIQVDTEITSKITKGLEVS